MRRARSRVTGHGSVGSINTPTRTTGVCRVSRGGVRFAGWPRDTVRVSANRREPNVMSDDVILVDEPAPRVRRITMNRPEKRNSLIHPLRGAILETLREADRDPDVRVMIVRGAGPSFSAGY